MTIEEIRALLNDIESDRVERTISTTNTDKFGQAICAFANDLPDHRIPGYLFLGVKDDGTVIGLDVTDELLKNVAAIRTDGNIQPQPSMTVEKVSMEEGDIMTEHEFKSNLCTTLDELDTFVEKNGQKNGHKNGHGGEQKPSKMKVSKFPAPIVEEVYKAIKLNLKAKYSWLQDNLGVSEATIKRAISDLKELGFINKEHSKIKGEWQLLK
jgi:predicted HTH transcriptional regulator